MSSVSEELEQLATQCQELYCQHQNALDSLERIQRLVDQGNAITVHYQCEDRDFGEVLEELHTETLEKGGSVRFGERLLEALHYMSFQTHLKN